MTIERARNYFGLFTRREILNPGDACLLRTKEAENLQIQVLGENIINIKRTGKSCYLEEEISLTGKKVNDANILGSPFFGVRDKIIWKPG